MRFLLPVAVGLGLLGSALGCSEAPDAAAYCAEAREAATADLPGTFARFDPAAPESSRAELDTALGRLRSLRDAASGDVRTDLSTLVSVGGAISDALSDLGSDPDGVRERIDGLSDRFAEADAASERVVTATRDACGVDLTAAAVPAAPAATTTSTP